MEELNVLPDSTSSEDTSDNHTALIAGASILAVGVTVVSATVAGRFIQKRRQKKAVDKAWTYMCNAIIAAQLNPQI